MKDELELLKEQSKVFRQIEIQMENVLLKNAVLQHKVDALGNPSLVLRELVDNNKLDVAEVRSEFINNVRDVIEYKQINASNSSLHVGAYSSKQQLKDLQDIDSFNEQYDKVNKPSSEGMAGKQKEVEILQNVIADLQREMKEFKGQILKI